MVALMVRKRTTDHKPVSWHRGCNTPRVLPAFRTTSILTTSCRYQPQPPPYFRTFCVLIFQGSQGGWLAGRVRNCLGPGARLALFSWCPGELHFQLTENHWNRSVAEAQAELGWVENRNRAILSY